MNTDIPCFCSLAAEAETIRDYHFYIHSSISTLSEFHWNNHVPEQNLLMKYDYLKMIEQLQQGRMEFRYVQIKKNDTTIGTLYFQIVRFESAQLINYFPEGNSLFLNIARSFTSAFLNLLNLKMLVSGNIFMTGENGYYFTNSIDKSTRAKLLRKAINDVLQQDKSIKAVLISDLYEPKSDFDKDFNKCGYNEIKVESDMSVVLNPAWKSFDDYLNALSSKYRVRTKKVFALCTENKVVRKELTLSEIASNEARLFELYRKVMANADFKLGSLTKDYFRQQKELLPDNYKIFAYYKADIMIGFISAFFINKKIEVHYTGMDYQVCKPIHLYQRMMYDMIEQGILLKVERLHFGRTAPEIKSTIGAVPMHMYGYLKHRNPLFNFLVMKPYTARLKPKQYVLRNPFK